MPDDGVLNDTEDEERLQADAASFIILYRLSRNLEAAIAMSTAIEVVGEPIRKLMSDRGLPNSPALVMEWRAGEDGPDPRDAIPFASPQSPVGRR